MTDLRAELVRVALAWEQAYGVAPSITNAISEYDAARLVGMSDAEYQADCAGRSAVTKGFDFRFRGLRYQVKANRPSGKPGSFVTLVNGPKNMDWDRLIWILYDREYRLVEAWEWSAADYAAQLAPLKRLGPPLMRRGVRRYPVEAVQAVLEAIPGAWEQAQEGLADAAAGRVVDLEGLVAEPGESSSPARASRGTPQS